MNDRQRDMALTTTFAFQAAVTAWLTRSPEEALLFHSDHFDPCCAKVLGKPVDLVTEADVQDLMLETAKKAVELLEGNNHAAVD